MTLVRIAPAGEKLSCRAGERAEFQFNLANTSGRGFTCGLEVRADGDAAWLEVQGGLERALTAGVDTVIVVRATPPATLLNPGDPPLTRAFRLRVFDSRNPEDAVERPTVAVAVSAGEAPKKRLPWKWISAAAVAAVCLVAVTIWLLLPSGVPDWQGQVLNETLAEEMLEAGFEPVVTQEFTDQPDGTILSQDPAPGAELPKPDGDAAIPLRLKVATSGIAVPDLTGKTLAEAEAALQAAHLKLGSVAGAAEDPASELVKVITQDPGAAEMATADTEVQLTLGPAQVTVPNLTGLTYAEAEAELKRKGLLSKLDKRQTGQAQPGVVFNQLPAANETAAAGTTVTLLVEEKMVAVAAVVGQTPDQARLLLTKQGFKVTSQFTGSVSGAARVTGQHPTAGTMLALGSQVTINYPCSGRFCLSTPVILRELDLKTLRRVR